MSFLQRRYHVPGTPPGTYDTRETREREAPRITIIDYSGDGLLTREGMAEISTGISGATRWIRISGHPSLQVLEALRDHLHLDPLVLEDIVNIGQRPKFADLETHLFVTLALTDIEDSSLFHQLSVCLVDDTVISFDDGSHDWFAPIVQRIERSSRARERGAAFLFYTLIDLAVDTLFPWLERAGERLDDLENEILDVPTTNLLAEVHSFRRDLLVVRKIAWATRDLIGEVSVRLGQEGDQSINRFLSDARDHIFTVIDLVEVHRDVASTLIELHMSMLSNRMNDVMKMLTLIATLFIPPTFVVGVYGMNFDRDAGPLSMPELSWPLGYLGVLGLILIMMVAMFLYFRRKHWL